MSSIFFDGKIWNSFWIIRFRELFARRSAICRGGIAVHFPRCRAESIILAAEIILPYLSTVMKGIADIKSTIPHFQNPILSAADKYLHATSIRKKYARRKIGKPEYFYSFRVLHKYMRIRKLRRHNGRPKQYERVPPAPWRRYAFFKRFIHSIKCRFFPTKINAQSFWKTAQKNSALRSFSSFANILKYIRLGAGF